MSLRRVHSFGVRLVLRQVLSSVLPLSCYSFFSSASGVNSEASSPVFR